MVLTLNVVCALSFLVAVYSLLKLKKLTLLTFTFANTKFFKILQVKYFKNTKGFYVSASKLSSCLFKESILYTSWKPKFNRLFFND